MEVDGGALHADLAPRLGRHGRRLAGGRHDARPQVALKFLHERFARTRSSSSASGARPRPPAGLQHPNVVGVYDRGEWDGTHYIAMEYVQGAALKDLIERGVTVGEAVEITRQILAGASFAHERGIVHRDLKPGNVLVDAEGRARVTDFGIARAGASEITQTGSVLGTAHYLSPEQAQGLEVDAPSDLYSVGVILYEALTGQVPFDGDSAVTIALKQVSEQPRPPSQLNPNVTPALDSVVLKALAKDPANRFATAEEFTRALDAAEADPSAIGDTAAYGAVGGAAAAAGLGAAAAATMGADPAEAAMAAEQEEARAGQGDGWMTRKRALIIAAIVLLLGGVAAFALTRPEQVPVPKVTEESQAQAQVLLEDAGFEVEVAPGAELQRAGPGRRAEPGRRGRRPTRARSVEITVSTGAQVACRQVKGLPEATAAKRLQQEPSSWSARSRRFSTKVSRDARSAHARAPASRSSASRR